MRSTSARAPIHPDPCPTLIVERGPEDKGVGSWVPEHKHRLLSHYLNASRGAWKQWPERIFIDPFCGPGRIQVKGESMTRDGGALVAWRTLAATAPFTRTLVGDILKERASACQQRLAALGAPAEAFPGPALATIKEMVAAVPRNSLCMAYIDPYNLELLDFDILRTLSKIKTLDLAVNFSLMDLHRNVDMELDPTRARFDAAAPGWRDQTWAHTTNLAGLPSNVFNYWCGLVKGLGFQYSEAMPIVVNDRGSNLYRVVFFSRHPFPNKIWTSVAQNPTKSFEF
jgi:three-Cys-motif partner protein